MTNLELMEDERFGVLSTETDRIEFQRMKSEMAPDLNDFSEGEKRLPRFGEFQSDGFEMFYRGVPKVKEVGEVMKDIEPHLRILGEMEKMEEIKKLRSSTSRNPALSLVACRKLNSIIDGLPDEVKRDLHKAQKDRERLENHLKRLESFRNMWKKADELGDEESKKKIEEMGKEINKSLEDLEESAEESEDDLEGSMEDSGDEIRSAVRAGLEECQEAVDSFQSMIDGFGLGSGSSSEIPAEDQMRIAEKVGSNDLLKKIAEMAGRMSRIGTKSRREKVQSHVGEITGIEMGGDVGKLTGEEMCNLAHPIMKKDLYSRILGNKAMIWKTEISEPKGKGPIIFCCDDSASMMSPNPDPAIWAKGLGLSLYRECVDRSQPFVYIHFSDDHRGATVFEFDGQRGEEEKFLECSELFLNGGTSYPLALNEMAKYLSIGQYKKADCVFVSDELFPTDSIGDEVAEFRTALEEAEASCLGIFIGSFMEGHRPFKQFCDGSWTVDPDGDDIEMISEMYQDHL